VSFPSIYNMLTVIQQVSRPLSHNVRGLLLLVGVWNIFYLNAMRFQLSTYMGISSSICVYVCAYAWVDVYTAVCTCHAHTTHTYTHTQHMLRCMPTPLYVHVTHTSHTHTHTHTTTRVCSCLPPVRSLCMHLLPVSMKTSMCSDGRRVIHE